MGKITAAAAMRRSEVIGPKVALWKKGEERTVGRTLFSSGGFGQREKNQYLGVAVRGDGEGGGGS